MVLLLLLLLLLFHAGTPNLFFWFVVLHVVLIVSLSALGGLYGIRDGAVAKVLFFFKLKILLLLLLLFTSLLLFAWLPLLPVKFLLPLFPPFILFKSSGLSVMLLECRSYNPFIGWYLY